MATVGASSLSRTSGGAALWHLADGLEDGPQQRDLAVHRGHRPLERLGVGARRVVVGEYLDRLRHGLLPLRQAVVLAVAAGSDDQSEREQEEDGLGHGDRKGADGLHLVEKEGESG